ncbi:MAG: SDR family oxidoreductase [Clostridia bacterium]|nr:SDR family oxidoreductase [Bacilli bacterium]MBR3511499.1 SDR family oxidoreductase [Clostridia bacterium]
MKKIIKKIIKKLNKKEKIAIPYLIEEINILKGKTVLITGGTGDIGIAIAKKVIKTGGKVIITGTSEEKIKETCHMINNENCNGVVLDLSKLDSIKKCIDDAIKIVKDSQIDILVNCAGYNPRKDFFSTTEEDFDKTIAVNVKGTFFISQVFAKYLIDRKIKGHILNISSSSALRPAWSSYEISKWAIKGFTIGLADNLIPYGIIVNSLAPGPTATKMQNSSDASDLDYSTPIKRMATTEEIASLAIMLISDYGNLIVGDTIYATGGSGVISLHN